MINHTAQVLNFSREFKRLIFITQSCPFNHSKQNLLKFEKYFLNES